MKKIIVWLLVLALLSGIGWVGYNWYISRGVSVNVFEHIPGDAIYILETTEPIKAWKEVSNSAMWKHLQKNEYFSKLTASANSLDSLVKENDQVFSLLGSRSLVVSAHMTSAKEFDFLFLVDIESASGIKFMEEYVPSISSKKLVFSTLKYNDREVIKMYDKSDSSSLYITIVNTYLCASFNYQLLKNSIDASVGGNIANSGSFAKMIEKINASGLLRVYINYDRLDNYLTCYLDGQNEYVNYLSRALDLTALSLDQKEELIALRGYTKTNDSVSSYMQALKRSGKGRSLASDIIPARTSFYMSLGFNSFTEFFNNVEGELKKDVKEYEEYQSNIRTIENFLDISVRDNFMSWIGEEAAFIQLQSAGAGLDNEVALILQTTNIEEAKKNLDLVSKKIRHRTPIKFKEVEYKGHKINYLSVKGLFKVLLGKFFARYDKPYYTIIKDKVVFSNHPQVLESMIDDYLLGNTMEKQEYYRNFRDEFHNRSAVFIYINTPILMGTMKNIANKETRSDMDRNKEFITCFRSIGFQLTPDGNKFETMIAEQFIDPFVEISDGDDSDDEVITEKLSADSINALFVLPYLYPKNPNDKIYKEYHSDSSTVKFEVELRYGFKDGNYTEYYPSGEVKMKGKFKKDKRDGTWRYYNEEGKLIAKKRFG
jgi:hypothetical protein